MGLPPINTARHQLVFAALLMHARLLLPIISTLELQLILFLATAKFRPAEQAYGVGPNDD